MTRSGLAFNDVYLRTRLLMSIVYYHMLSQDYALQPQ